TSPTGSSLTYSWDLNGDGVFGDATGPNVQAVLTGVGQQTITVKVTDANGLSVLGSLQVTVQNVAPVANAGQAQTINEGGSASISGSVSDPGTANETYTYAWDFTYDGQHFVAQAFGQNAQQTYLQPGMYQVALQVIDSNGGVGLSTTTVTVQDVPPTANAGI